MGMQTHEPVVIDLDELFRTHYAQSVRLAHLLTGSNAAAEDLAQDAFARMHRHRGAIDNPGAYLRQTVINVCRSWHRSRSREQSRVDRLDAFVPTLPFEAEELVDALGRLSYKQRSVLVLRYWLDLSEADIALTLDCRPGTVKSLHARALAHLRTELPR